MSVSFDEPIDPEESITGSEVLGDDVHRWKSANGLHDITFGRPRGVVSIKVARILGPQQAANPVLDAYYKAMCSIRTWSVNGIEKMYDEPNNDMQFEAAFASLGEESLNAFTFAWQMSLYPEAVKAMREGLDAGESPEALDRIAKNAGMQHSKKSRSRSSSAKP